MAVYVVSDIHGEYDKLMEILEKIDLKESDKLYILGDILDRGPHPIKVMIKIMGMANVIPIVGNHEIMGLRCLPFLMQEITEESIDGLDREMMEALLLWQENGFSTTVDEFRRLDREMQQVVIDYIGEFLVYEELTVNGQEYLLVHAGLSNFSPDKKMEDYALEELIWERADYRQRYFEDKIVVTGHTPTQLIKENPHPGRIYRNNGHIAIDCGACFRGGRLGAICLDTGEEFYSSDNE